MAATAVSTTVSNTESVTEEGAGALDTGENMFIPCGLLRDLEGVSDEDLEILVSQACEITVDLAPLVRWMFDICLMNLNIAECGFEETLCK